MAERFIAIVSLDRPAKLHPDQLIGRLRKSAPEVFGGVSAVQANPGGGGEDDTAYLLDVSGTMISVMFLDQPVPAGTYTNAIQGSLHWPQAAEALQREQAHIIVASLAEADELGAALRQATYVMLVAATLAEAKPVIGVYWVAGETVTEVSYFTQSGKKLLAGELPVEIWVQLGLYSERSEGPGAPFVGAATTGLSPFISREIEFKPCALEPAVLASRLIGTIQYLVTQGVVFNAGDTLGVSEEECIRVDVQAQGRRPGVPVYALSLEKFDDGVS